MTTFDRFERDLPMLLDELAAPRTPDYIDDTLSLTERTSQRPGWTFPERWLPMSAITERMATTPRVPMRAALAVALLILALVAAAIYVGSQQRRLPEPFGPAGNGLVAYSSGGDIFTADPVTGAAKAIVTGPELDRNPIFSRDGTKIVFRRQGERLIEFDLVVVDADGGNLRVINTEPMSMQDPIEWTADSAGIIALTEHEEIVRLDASKAAPPQVLGTQINASGSIVWNANLRPPEGDQFLIRNHDATALQVVNLDGSGTRTLVEAPGGKEHADSENFGNFAWSPDGSQIAFTMRPEIGSEELRIYVMNADGTNVRRLEHEPGPLVTVDFAWSPDGTKIAYNRWHQGELDLWEVMPIGVAKVADGTVVDAGPAPVSEGAVFGWSPDGSTIVSLPGPVYDGIPNALTAAPTAIDIATGESRELDVDVQSATSWQRVAP